MLIESGADITIKDKNWKDVIEIANEIEEEFKIRNKADLLKWLKGEFNS